MSSILHYPIISYKTKELRNAIVDGNLSTLSRYIPTKYHVNQPFKFDSGGGTSYALLLAVESNQPDLVKYLLEKGADITKKDIRGMTVFHKIANSPYMSRELVNIFYENENDGFYLNDQLPLSGNTLVHLAVVQENVYVLERALKQFKKLKVASIRNYKNDTPLTLALKLMNDNPIIPIMLIKYVIRVSDEHFYVSDGRNQTPLDLANKYGKSHLYSLMSEYYYRPVRGRLSSESPCQSHVSMDYDEDEMHNDTKSTLHHNEVSALTTDFDALNINNDNVTEDLQREKEININLNEEIKKLQNQIANLTNDHDVNYYKKQNKQLIAAIEEKNKKIDNYERLIDIEKSDMTTVIVEKDEKIESLENKLSNMKKELQQTHKTICELQEESKSNFETYELGLKEKDAKYRRQLTELNNQIQELEVRHSEELNKYRCENCENRNTKSLQEEMNEALGRL